MTRLAIIAQAIQEKRRISLVYKGGRRVIEPKELVGANLFGYQVDGASNTEQFSGYKTMRVEKISGVRLLKSHSSHI